MIEGNVFIYIHFCILILSLILTIIFGLFSIAGDSKLDTIICYTSFFILVTSMAFYIVGATKCEKSAWVVDDDPYSVEKIISLKDNNLTYGRMYLRRGYFEENLYYQYMVQLNNGGFIANKVNSSNATLYYAKDDFRVEWYMQKKKWLYWEIERTYNKIYIPEGSITDDYSVDLN